jgi:serine protease Do
MQVQLASLAGSDKEEAAEPAPDTKSSALDEFGLGLAPAKNQAGVVITKIDPNGKAADSGLQEGDVIVSVGKTKVAAPAEFDKEVAAARGGGSKAVLLQVKNGKQTRFIGLSVANT